MFSYWSFETDFNQTKSDKNKTERTFKETQFQVWDETEKQAQKSCDNFTCLISWSHYNNNTSLDNILWWSVPKYYSDWSGFFCLPLTYRELLSAAAVCEQSRGLQ